MHWNTAQVIHLLIIEVIKIMATEETLISTGSSTDKEEHLAMSLMGLATSTTADAATSFQQIREAKSNQSEWIPMPPGQADLTLVQQSHQVEFH